MPSGRGRHAFRGRFAIPMAAESLGFARTRMLPKPRWIDAARAVPSMTHLQPDAPSLQRKAALAEAMKLPKGKAKQQKLQQLKEMEQKPREIVFPEDKLFPALYARLPILQYEAGADPYLRDGVGEGNRPLLAQRIVRRQQQYIDSGMTVNQSWLHARRDFDSDLRAYRFLTRGDAFREEVAGALTADVTTLKIANRVWVERIAEQLTGKKASLIHFHTVEQDGLPSMRELVQRVVPPDDSAQLPTPEQQFILSQAFRYCQSEEPTLLREEFPLKSENVAGIESYESEEQIVARMQGRSLRYMEEYEDEKESKQAR